MMENQGTEVIYVRGNHDDFLDHLAPMSFYNIRIVKDWVLESNGKRYYVTHGDIFDTVTTHMKWLAKLGDVGYTFLLWMNKVYNNYRLKQGKPYYSLSQAIKQKVKSAVSYISDFEKELVAFARARKCDGVICGHIHHPDMAVYEGIQLYVRHHEILIYRTRRRERASYSSHYRRGNVKTQRSRGR